MPTLDTGQYEMPITTQGSADPWVNAYLNAFSQDMGVKSVRTYAQGARTVRELLKDRNLWSGVGAEFNEKSYNSAIKALKRSGLDIDKAYGRTTGEIASIRDEIRSFMKGFGKGDTSRMDKAAGKAAAFATQYGEARFELTPEILPGLAGVPSVKKSQILYDWQRRNPDKNIGNLSTRELSKLFGVKESEIGKAQLSELKDFSTSDQFQQYTNTREMATQSLDLANKGLKFYSEMIEKIRQPGYADELTNQIFAPQETEFKQYWEPTGGAAISEAAKGVGAQEAAMGRTGYTQVMAELARQKGLAQERLQSQKTSYRGQLQQHIDLQQPGDILRMSSQVGQQFPFYANVLQNQMLEPYKQAFPLLAQQQQMQLAPYQFGAVVQNPEFMDYLGAGLGMAGDVFGMAGSVGGLLKPKKTQEEEGQ